MRPYWFPLFWALVIGFLCTLGSDDLPKVSFWDWLSFDKLVHVGMFAVMVLSFIVCLKKQTTSAYLKNQAIWAAVVFSVVYGACIEGAQYLMNIGRSAELKDIVANTVGCILGVYFFRFIYGKALFAASSS